jgi:hypothetical protein
MAISASLTFRGCARFVACSDEGEEAPVVRTAEWRTDALPVAAVDDDASGARIDDQDLEAAGQRRRLPAERLDRDLEVDDRRCRKAGSRNGRRVRDDPLLRIL